MLFRSENSEFVIAPYLVSLPASDGTRNGKEYDVIAHPKTEPVKRNPEVIDICVYKVWAGAAGTPKNISVQLYRNGTPHESSVILSAGNSWSHTWTGLNPADKWTVDEVQVPAGFVKTISGDVTTGFIITNTRQNVPDEPSRPEEPDKPEKPKPPKTSDENNMQLWVTSLIAGSIGLCVVILIILRLLKRKKSIGNGKARRFSKGGTH